MRLLLNLGKLTIFQMAPITSIQTGLNAAEVNEFLLLNPDLGLLEIELDDDGQLVAKFGPKTKEIKDETRDRLNQVDDRFVQRVDGHDEEDIDIDAFEM